eukprot:GHVO01000836.1.p1 GENE.GHVO01000836.1~~GHVO01000836.1.p1  ORF type:complete len:272 (+),score=30.53 GHVO01000836.1:35-817(+)
MKLLSLFRYALVAYGLLLEAFYPFDSLPFAIIISNAAKESLKSQAHDLAFWSAVISMSLLSICVIMTVWYIYMYCIIAIVAYIRPSVREHMDKCMAERKAKDAAQNKKKPSRRALWTTVLLNLLFSVATIVNDAIFNRPEDAVSFEEGVLQRAQYLQEITRSIVRAQLMILPILFFLGLVFSLVRTMIRLRRKRGAIADEESRLAHGEIVEVEVQQTTTQILEGKLVDLSDGMGFMYEKMESYTVPSDANKSDEEVLIKL